MLRQCLEAQQVCTLLSTLTRVSAYAFTTINKTKMIIEKVDEACKLVEKDGEAAFAKFKGKDSDFIFAGTYIWVHEPEMNTMLCHPIKYKMQGNSYSHLKDSNGKFFFVEMSKVAKEQGSGWVDYTWPKPGEKTQSPKVSYIKLAEHGGKKYVVGCGVYDMTMDDVKKELGE